MASLHRVPFADHSPEQDELRAPYRNCGGPWNARIAERFAPPHVVVTENGEIVHFSARTGKYLEAPPGAPDRQLFAMARKGLRLDLRAVLREAIDMRRAATRQNVKIETDDNGAELVSLTAEPLPDRDGGQSLFLILFQGREASTADAAQPLPGEREPTNDAARLESELFETRERLQATIEEYETALEELKSANEELISLNEETQSTNEELESSKEELQSLNEEMRTVNHELESKIDDLDRANSDLRNVFASTRIATIFMDHNLVIRSFTPTASQIFNIIPSDAGRPLTDLAAKLDYPDLTADLRKVLESGASIERRVHKNDADAPYYLARLTAYRERLPTDRRRRGDVYRRHRLDLLRRAGAEAASQPPELDEGDGHRPRA